MMSEKQDLTLAFQRLVEDPDFAEAVVEDPKVLDEYDLTDEEIDALVSDANALEGEVQGFAVRTMAQVLFVGGLRTPPLLTGFGAIGPARPFSMT